MAEEKVPLDSLYNVRESGRQEALLKSTFLLRRQRPSQQKFLNTRSGKRRIVTAKVKEEYL